MSKGPTPESYAKTSEESHQIALFIWAQQNMATYPELRWLFHCPNGGFRTKSEGAKLKAGGVKKGIPDIALPIKSGPCSGLWIELKVGKNKLQPDQIEWVDKLRDEGFDVAVCYGWEAARDAIVNYLSYR